MDFKEINNQYVFTFQKGDYSLFYNNINGNIAIAKDFSYLEDKFYEPAKDLAVNVDEVNYEQLYLAVSESCNFNCKYCRQQKTHSLENMSTDEIKLAIDAFYSVSKTPKSVVFFGGEPLLNIQGIQFAIEYIRSFDKTIAFSMVINGSLCDEKLARFFAMNNVEVIVSMDGPEDIHNQARLFKGGGGTYKNAIRGYRNLKKSGCITGITSVIGPHNENCFNRLIEWAIQLRPNSLGFCLPHGDYDNFAMKLSSFNKVHESMIEAFDVLHLNGIHLVQVEQKLKSFMLGYSVPFECKACGKRIVACKNNKYGICEGAITKHEFFHDNIGHLRTFVREYKKTSPYLIPTCRTCIAYRICGGSCVYDKLIRHGRADVPDTCRCGLNVKIAERAMKHIVNGITILQDYYILTQEDRNKLLALL